MSQTTIIGGSLGAGKTTLLENLIKNNSFSQRLSGVVVMDAAGQVDFDRLRRAGEEKGVRVINATAACAVCGGPSTALREHQELRNQGVEDVVIELSGRVAIPSMQNKLLGNDISAIRTAYVLDPKTIALVGAAGELPFAQVVGITKNPADTQTLNRYAPRAKVLDISQDYSGTLEEFFMSAPTDLFEGEFKRPHSHNHDPDLTTQFFANIENPYEGFEALKKTIEGLGVYRAKGHLALDATKVVQFDYVNDRLSAQEVDDTLAANGVIMLANPGENKFSRRGIEEALTPFIEKPDVPPVMRIYSGEEQVNQYIKTALRANNFDEALGAAEQYQFEREDDSLIRQVMPAFVRGKQTLIEETPDTPSRALQGLSLVYALHTHRAQTPALEQARITANNEYLSNISSLTNNDWENIRKDDSEMAEYLVEVAGWARNYQ